MSLGFFARHTISGLAADLRSGATSPSELVEHALAAATALDPKLNAFVTVDADNARSIARQAALELAAGVDRGPLHGIPVAVKDIVDTAGLLTTMGSRHFAGHVPTRDAACVRRLRAAGAVIVGKATTHEFAYGPTGDRSANGPSRNPHRLDRISGGSSGGSAVAVAAGIVPAAIGTDTGGSVRIPAACCGIVGLKPTTGAVSTEGVFPLAPSLDTVGPMTRTAEDCRLLWQALLAGEPHEVDVDRPLRIGWVPPRFPAEQSVVDAARAAVDVLRRAGAQVDEVVPPDLAELRWAYTAIQGREVAAVHANRLATAPELYDDEVLARLQEAAQVSTVDFRRAGDIRRRAQSSVAALLREHHLLALPTVPIVAPPVDTRSVTVAGAVVRVRDALLSLTSPWSVLGLPALTTPAGWVDGLPAGLQLVAAPGAESLLLGVAQRLGAHHFEREPLAADGAHAASSHT